MLQISKADYDLIRWEAERTYPRESCGILLGNVEGERRRVTLTITCQNMPPDATSGRYRIDPETVNAALKLAHSRAETIIGFYHSHPDRPARHSGTDLDEAHWFDCSYVITTVEAGRAKATNSFALTGSEDNKAFALEEIQITAYRRMPIAL